MFFQDNEFHWGANDAKEPLKRILGKLILGKHDHLEPKCSSSAPPAGDIRTPQLVKRTLWLHTTFLIALKFTKPAHYTCCIAASLNEHRSFPEDMVSSFS